MNEFKDGYESNPTIAEIYRDPNYVTLYRYENPNVPYDETREGIISRRDLVGLWFCDSLDDLYHYAISRGEGWGRKGGRFVTVRVKKDELSKFDATTHPSTKGMDLESGNCIIPKDIIEETGLYIPAPFNEKWLGRRNLPMKDWKIVRDFIQERLNDEALQLLAESRLTHSKRTIS